MATTPDHGKPSRTRRAVAVLTLVGQLILGLTLPMPAPAAMPDGPFPCRGHVCGCRTAAECWAGDCCCFTLGEKLVWAEANGVEAPAHVRPMVESRPPKPAPAQSCCQTPAAPACCSAPKAKPEPIPVRWVSSVAAKGCRGDQSGIAADLDPIATPQADRPVQFDAPAGFVLAVDRDASPTRVRPPVPPPRLA